MPTYQFRYSSMQYSTVEAKDITDAAITARKFLAGMPGSTLHDIIRTEPPIEAEVVEAKKPDDK